MKKFKCNLFSCFCLFSDSSDKTIDKNDIMPKSIIKSKSLKFAFANQISDESNPVQSPIVYNQNLQSNK